MRKYRMLTNGKKYKAQWLNTKTGFFQNKEKWVDCGQVHHFGFTVFYCDSAAEAQTYIDNEKYKEELHSPIWEVVEIEHCNGLG